MPPVVRLLGALAAAVLLLDAARRALLLFGVSAAAVPAQRSPCNRICRRNPSFMDGTVCIGCFLADDEVRGWSSFTSREREWALLDAAERRSAWEEHTGVTESDAGDEYGGFDALPRPWTVLLDRDGVLNKDVGSPGVVRGTIRSAARRRGRCSRPQRGRARVCGGHESERPAQRFVVGRDA